MIRGIRHYFLLFYLFKWAEPYLGHIGNGKQHVYKCIGLCWFSQHKNIQKINERMKKLIHMWLSSDFEKWKGSVWDHSEYTHKIEWPNAYIWYNAGIQNEQWKVRVDRENKNIKLWGIEIILSRLKHPQMRPNFCKGEFWNI